MCEGTFPTNRFSLKMFMQQIKVYINVAISRAISQLWYTKILHPYLIRTTYVPSFSCTNHKVLLGILNFSNIQFWLWLNFWPKQRLNCSHSTSNFQQKNINPLFLSMKIFKSCLVFLITLIVFSEAVTIKGLHHKLIPESSSQAGTPGCVTTCCIRCEELNNCVICNTLFKYDPER